MPRIYPPFVRGPGAIGLLILRLVMGTAFILHGWPKIQNATVWMGPDGPPGAVQAFAAVSEFGGGIALILGLLTPLAALGIAGTMVGALAMVHLRLGHAFVAGAPGEPSFELALGYLANALMLLTVGPGGFSLDALLFGRSTSQTPGGSS